MKKFLMVSASIVLLTTLSISCNTKPNIQNQPLQSNFNNVESLSANAPHFTYEGEHGPTHWGDLSHDYIMCKTGKSQSPINIETTNTLKTQLVKIPFSYNKNPLKVTNNGHAIQVNLDNGGILKYEAKEYKLLQFHFHAPSEHTLNGKAYSMEVHLVHKNSEGEILVVGVFMEKGKENPIIQNIWNNIPKEEGQESVIKNIIVEPSSLLPSKQNYYNYSGSLTTPPCSEPVKWIVMKNTIEVSEAQIAKFKEFYKFNARPVLAINGRKILESL